MNCVCQASGLQVVGNVGTVQVSFVQRLWEGYIGAGFVQIIVFI